MRGTLEQVQRLQEDSPGAGEAGRLRSENRALSRESRSLRGDNHRLTTELYRLQEENSRLNKVGQCCMYKVSGTCTYSAPRHTCIDACPKFQASM